MGYSDERGIAFQRYEADGTPVDGERLITENFSEFHSFPKIVALDDGGYLVSWSERPDYVSNTPEYVKALRFDATGTAVGEIITVAENHADGVDLRNEDVKVLDNGDLIFTWSVGDPASADTDGVGVFSRTVSLTSDIGFQAGDGSVLFAEDITVTDIDGDTLAGATVSFAYSVMDGQDLVEQQATITVTGDNDAPVVNPPSDIGFQAGDGFVIFAHDIAVTDIDNDMLAGATVSFAGGYVPGEDLLSFDPPPGSSIIGSFDAGTGILTLSGNAPLADYQAALRNVAYQNPSQSVTEGSRVLSFQVDDGSQSANLSTVVSTTIDVENPPPPANTPPVPTTTQISATEDGGGSGVLAASDADGDPLSFALVEAPNQGELVISADGSYSFTDPNGLFDNLAEGETRDLTFRYSVTDGQDLVEQQATITVTGTNDAPVVNISPPDPGGFTDEVLVNSTTAGGQYLPTPIAFDDGSFSVVWQGGPSTGRDVFYQAYDSDGQAIGGEVRLNDTPGEGVSAHSVASTADGGFVVVWEGDPAEVLVAQRFDSSGTALGDQIEVSPAGRGSIYMSRVAGHPDGGFVTVWYEHNAPGGSHLDVLMRRFDDAGDPLNDPTFVHSNVSDAQLASDIAVQSDGSFLVSFVEGNSKTVAVSHFNADGSAGSDTISIGAISQTSIVPRITALQDGSYVATWSDSSPNDYVHVQALDEFGNPVGQASVLDTQVYSFNHPADVKALSDGGYVVTWGYKFDGNFGGIAAQRFDASGTPTDDPWLLNEYTDGVQVYPSVEELDDGSLAFTWHSRSSALGDGDGGIAMRVLKSTSSNPVFEEGQDPVLIAAGVEVSDVDSVNLGGAVVSISLGFAAGEDVLAFTAPPGSGIIGNYDAGTGVLTLSGEASLVDYQAALASVTYANTSTHPDETDRQITIQVDDGATESNLSNVITVTVAVEAGTNTAPVPGTTAITANEDTGAAGTLEATDADGDPLTFSLVTGPSAGTVTITPAGAYAFDPQGDFEDLGVGETRDVTFTYAVFDGIETVQQVATITVTGANDGPVVVNPTAGSSVSEDTSGAIGGPVSFNVLGGVDDPDGDALTVVGIAETSSTGVALTATSTGFSFDTGHFNYLKAGETETVTIDYTVTDGTETVTGPFTLTVTGANDGPIVVNPTAGSSVSEDTSGAIGGPVSFNVLGGVDDPDGDALTVVGIAESSSTGVALTATSTGFSFDTGHFNYLKAGETETVTIDYTVTDGTETVTGPFTLTIHGANDGPVAVADAAETDENAPVFIDIAGLLANDTDADGDSLSFAGITSVTGGSASVIGDQVVFVPDFGYHGAATFTYAVSDGAATDDGTVNVTVRQISVDLTGTVGGETLTAGVGNDTLEGRGGDDVLIGDTGDDSYEYSSGDGSDTVTDSDGEDQIVLLANSLGDVVSAERVGDDLIIGFRDGGSITVSNQFSNGAVEVIVDQQTDADGAVVAEVSRLIAATATGTHAAEFIAGTAGDDTLSAGGRNDAVFGGAGDDTVSGGSGADIISGGTGDDHLDGGSSSDTYRYSLGDGADVIDDASGSDRLELAFETAAGVAASSRDGDDLLVTFTDGGSVRFVKHYDGQAFETIDDGTGSYRVSTRDDHRGGNGNDWIAGTTGDDVIDGGRGDDALFGGDGDDRLIGGDGDNLAVGGAGADSFAVTKLAGMTTIADFSTAEGDEIDISSVVSGFDAQTNVNDYVSVTAVDADGDGAVDDLRLSVTADGADATPVEVVQILDTDAGSLDLAAAINGRGANTAPTATDDDDIVVQQDQALTFDTSVLIANDSDPESDPLTITAVAPGSHGTVSLDGGTITFTPEAGYHGPASFSYTLTDDRGLSDTASVEVVIEPAQFVEGNAVDGYIEGGLVFADANNNGVLDEGESSTTTGIDGYFKLADADGPLVITGVMRAPAGSTVITPLTTLLAAMVDDGTDLATAKTLLADALDLDPGIDITTLDPVEGTLSGDPVAAAAAAQVMAQGIAVQNTIVQIASALGADSGTGSAQAFDAVAEHLASHIATNGANTDLTDAGQIGAVVSAATTGLTTAEVDGVASIVSGSNAASAAAVAGGAQGAALLGDLAQLGLVSQGAAAASISAAVTSGSAQVLDAAVNQFTGANLDAAVTAAADDIGDVDGATRGTPGNDRLIGTNGDDIIDGADRIYGRDGDDNLMGGDGNDTIQGQDGADELRGGDGNDRLYADGDDTVIDGGDGYDRLYTRGDADMNIDLAAAGIEEAVGGAGDDTFDASAASERVRLYGKAGDDVLSGGAGNDYIRGDDGHDVLSGGAGNDILDERSGADQLSGGDGDDRLYADFLDGVIDGGAGYDRLYLQEIPGVTAGVTIDMAASGIEEVYGTAGNDTFDASGASDRVRMFGRDGSDVLTGGAGNDRLYVDYDDVVVNGGDGYDRVYVRGEAGVYLNLAQSEIEEVIGGAGRDLFDGSAAAGRVRLFGKDGDDFLSGGAGNDHLRGDGGNDTILGGAGNDVLEGKDGADRIRAGAGDDRLYVDSDDSVIDGGDGYDRLYVQGAGGVSLDLAATGIEEAFGSDGNDLFNGSTMTERVRLYGKDGNDLLAGGAGNDHLRGDDGNDVLTGGDGNDVLEGRADADELRGGAGDDRLYADADDTVIDGGDGYDRLYVQGSEAFTLDLAAAGIEEAFGAAGDDRFDASGSQGRVRIYGKDGDDDIKGGAGNDHLRGGAGNDYLRGDGGGDVLTGGAGDDRLYVDSDDTVIDGGAGYDRLYVQGDGGVTADLAANGIEEAYGGAGDDSFDGTAALGRVRLYGKDGDAVLTGGAGNDFLRGDGGQDLLSGGAGNDVIEGRDGNDTLSGGSGVDRLYGGDGDDFLIVDASDSVIRGGAGFDRLSVEGETGINLDVVRAEVEAAIGGSGADTLDASGAVAGDDTITGGTGADVLTGGGGSDRFDFDQLSGNDTVNDFQVGEDHLALAQDLQIINLLRSDVDGDGTDDLVIELDNDSLITLLGVQDDVDENDLLL